MQPRRHLGVSPIATGLPKRGYIGILQSIRCVFGIPHDADGDRPQAILMPSDEGRECVRISSDVSAQQRGVGYGVTLSFTLAQATTSTS
jgi:hypothetical protein